MNLELTRTLAAWALLGALSCGGSAAVPEPQSPESSAAEVAPEPEGDDMTTSAEVGGLDAMEAEQSFRASLAALQACVKVGMQRIAFLGGSIEFAVKVDSKRHAASVWAAASTLGERATEKCMFEA